MLSDPGLKVLLAPGESLRAYLVVSPTSLQGADREASVGVDPSRPAGQSVGSTLGGLVTGNWVPRWARGDVLERMFGGVARAGANGSDGAQLRAFCTRVVRSCRLIAGCSSSTGARRDSSTMLIGPGTEPCLATTQ